MYWYHTEPIGKGVFGHIFAGINSKDGMEVAVKRIENLRLERRQDEREAYTFASLTGCRNVVHYLAFCTDVHFSFIILELMEGNLNKYFESPHFNSSNNITLCRDVFCGINYLHGENIVHRDIKPSNILYKTHPELCVKIADFDLSRRLDIDSSFTVMAPGVGTRGWIAPEVVKSTPYKHSMESDIFSCGLITHYIFSPKKHPFSPAVCTGKSDLQINQETEKNISDGKMESFDGSIAPEASDCIKKMLDINEKERPTAEAVLKHPMFWSNKKKMNLLTAVGNQPEFEIPRVKRTVLSPIESDLQSNVSTIVKYGKWDDPRYTHMPGIYSEMTKPIVKPAKKG
ncbi:Serine/threonine-protein kinase/endoribonuclease IRE2, partial [Exaiptasia diaphana]